ncbi:MAG: hypothetical protein ABIQ00_03760 [Chitinophagaceae bacterium]
MKKNPSIKLKAVFLLIVFSLNTVVGFACTLGMDIGFNSKHHDEDQATEVVVHVHAGGKKHVHQEKKESHSDDKSHQHDQANHQKKSGNEKDNCCNDKVTKFEQLDKSVPASLSTINPLFFVALVSSFYDIDVLFTSRLAPNIKHFVRSYHPPIPNIRIAIQSFQI